MTTRERWYALHRARRVFRREQDELIKTFGAGRHAVSVAAVVGVFELLINPPLMVDPALPDGGLNVFKPRRLP